jgi:hypothetical protein
MVQSRWPCCWPAACIYHHPHLDRPGRLHPHHHPGRRLRRTTPITAITADHPTIRGRRHLRPSHLKQHHGGLIRLRQSGLIGPRLPLVPQWNYTRRDRRQKVHSHRSNGRKCRRNRPLDPNRPAQSWPFGSGHTSGSWSCCCATDVSYAFGCPIRPIMQTR